VKRIPWEAKRWKLGAFHGTTWYKVPAIARRGRLVPGASLPVGVYLHKHGTADKAMGYGIFQGIGHGVLVLPLWEVALRENPQRIRTDQWIVYPPRHETDIQLLALWIGVFSMDRVPEAAGNSINAFPGAWRPEFEA